MSQLEKLLFRILRGASDTAIDFDDLRRLLLRLGFEERVRGSIQLTGVNGTVQGPEWVGGFNAFRHEG